MSHLPSEGRAGLDPDSAARARPAARPVTAPCRPRRSFPPTVPLAGFPAVRPGSVRRNQRPGRLSELHSIRNQTMDAAIRDQVIPSLVCFLREYLPPKLQGISLTAKTITELSSALESQQNSSLHFGIVTDQIDDLHEFEGTYTYTVRDTYVCPVM